MRIVIVYESSYGNTHQIAEAICAGLIQESAEHEVQVLPVARALPEVVERADLLVVGGPTHAHGMSREQTRQAAVEAARKPGSPLALDHDAEGPGLRDWFATLGPATGSAAAFDTRVDAPALITGRASKGIGRQLQRHGYQLVDEPMSFFVTKENTLGTGQLVVAREWGQSLAGALAEAPTR